MGSVLKQLCRTQLPGRERHHSRIFVDLAENIHLHFREYRLVFSLDEYFEFADTIAKSTEDVKNFLEQNPDYHEGVSPDTVMIAGGKARQLKFLANSPAPHQSTYLDQVFAVELQDPSMTDEIHLHYRDLRMTMNRENFKALARAIEEAGQRLEAFERSSTYIRVRHPDRDFSDFNQDEAVARAETVLGGVTPVPLKQVKSHWYGVLEEWRIHPVALKNFKREALEDFKHAIEHGERIPPILLTQADDRGCHTIVDGHHRVWAAFECGRSTIDAVIVDLSFEASEELRVAERALKRLDERTAYRYGVSSFLQQFLAYRLNRFYTHVFKRCVTRDRGLNRLLRLCKRALTDMLHAPQVADSAHPSPVSHDLKVAAPDGLPSTPMRDPPGEA